MKWQDYRNSSPDPNNHETEASRIQFRWIEVRVEYRAGKWHLYAFYTPKHLPFDTREEAKKYAEMNLLEVSDEIKGASA